MKRFIFFFIVSLLISSFASADTITCVFTEPFFSAVYDSEKQNVLILNGFEENSEPGLIPGVKLLILGPGQFQVLNRANDVILDLNLNFKGNNGMSDTIYPFDATFTLPGATDGEDLIYKGPHRGGCFSSLLKSQEPDEYPNP